MQNTEKRILTVLERQVDLDGKTETLRQVLVATRQDYYWLYEHRLPAVCASGTLEDFRSTVGLLRVVNRAVNQMQAEMVSRCKTTLA